MVKGIDGDGDGYLLEPVEFYAARRCCDPVLTTARFPTPEAALSAIRNAQAMATIDLSILLARS